MSAISECLGSGHEFLHKGRTYHVSLVNEGIKEAWEKRLFSDAKAATSGLRDIMDREDYSRHLKCLLDDYQEGKYALESPRSMAMLQQPKGMLILISLLMGITEMEGLKILAERQDDLAALLTLVLRESFPQPEEAPASDAQPAQEVPAATEAPAKRVAKRAVVRAR
jgi:hypothetical protein